MRVNRLKDITEASRPHELLGLDVQVAGVAAVVGHGWRHLKLLLQLLLLLLLQHHVFVRHDLVLLLLLLHGLVVILLPARLGTVAAVALDWVVSACLLLLVHGCASVNLGGVLLLLLVLLLSYLLLQGML